MAQRRLRVVGMGFLPDIKMESSNLLPEVNFPANNLNFLLKVKVMGSNPGYRLESFLL